MDKQAVIIALRAAVGSDLDALTRMVAASRDEATSSESKAESKYDTRATEASYLAAGQGQRLSELRVLAGWLEQLDADRAHTVAGTGALVEVDRDGEVLTVLLGPHGGHHVTLHGRTVRLISATSPLGRALTGLGIDDAAEVDTPRGQQVLEVVGLR